MSSEFHSRVTVIVDDEPLGVFDEHTPGEATGGAAKSNPGGMEKPRIRKGRPTFANGTVRRAYLRERDFELARRLRQRAGRATIVVSDQELDDDGNPWGQPIITRGVVERVNRGASNSESDDPKWLEIEYITEDET